MKYGMCVGGIKNGLPLAKMCLGVGFDFIEINAGALAQLTNEEVDKYAAMNLPIYSANCMLPGSYPGTEDKVHVVGPERNLEWCKSYAEELMRKCAKLGIKRIVFGGGNQRRVPDGMDKEEACRQYREACTIFGDEAAKYDITIVVEPLNYDECNCINTMEEGFEQVKLVNHPNVQLLMDIFHVHKNGEATEYSEELAKSVLHIHWSDIPTRNTPRKVTEEQEKFAKLIKAMNYDGTISIEGNFPEDEEHANAALAVFKTLFE